MTQTNSYELNKNVDGSQVHPKLTSSIDFLQHCQQLIGVEESFKGILKRFVSILVDYFGLTQAVYFLADEPVEDAEPKRGMVRFPPIKMLEEEVIQKLRPILNEVTRQDPETCSGVGSVKLDSRDFLFASFEDSSGRMGYLVWKQPPLTVKTPPLRQLKDSTGSMLPILDFITRSVQQNSRWFKRLDKTQALLYQDEVTGLYNYRYLDVAIDGELKRLHRFHAPFSLLFIDLDNFKSVNDQHGHITGSNVLKQVGAVIKLAVRDVDNVIRYGGDEFVVVLIGANSRQALQAGERVRSRHGRDRKTILKMADETMYASKKNGKNRVMSVTAVSSVDGEQTQTSESK
ncbi:MAG: GGDEF domain-containing protein [Proteobacteria bacterium]|nr:GGDEF domain-containing protein [Pseudomonadota bacterium]